MIMDENILAVVAKEKGWSNELLYQLVESIKDYAIFATDLDGTIVSWNVGAENVFGYPALEAIGQNCQMLFTEEDKANNEPEKEKETARTEGRAEDERWHIRKDGSHFFASGLQTPLYDENGNHTGYAKIARDLTERIKLQDDLQELRNNLEVQVRQRTSELNESNELLRSEVKERTESERLRTALLRKILKTQEDERKRIAREIHDHVGQQMTGLQIQLHLLLNKYEKDSEMTDDIKKVKSIANQIDSDVNFLAWELRPSVLDDFGLPLAMNKYVEDWSKQFGIPAEFNQIGLDGKHLLPEIEINLYRIGQEALNNTCKYAKASNASVSLQRRNGTVSLIIEDDGIGFEPTPKAVMTGNDDRGMGLLGMKERAELIGGSIEIESSPGNGTTIYVRVPAQFDEERK
jgi:PAS domain S-box-containing protein